MQVMIIQSLVLCTIMFFGGAQPAPSPASSPAAAPGSADSVETVRCEFNIDNLDYEDVAEHADARDGIRHAVKDMIDGAMEEAVAPAAPAGAPGPAPAFLQLHAFPKVFAKQGVHSALHVNNAQRSMMNASKMHASGPAPGPASSPAAAPAPNNVQTFVALSEGPDDSVQGDAWVVTSAENLPVAKKEMEKVCTPTGVANALLGADGIHWKHAPVITGCSVKERTVVKFQLDCAPHVKTIVDRFTVAYTRAQVPHALEQACHLFDSKISFSGNRRITKWDRKACKMATEKLMSTWGQTLDSKGSKDSHGFELRPPSRNQTKKEPDYEAWCHDICELKLGKGAPQCHI